MGGMSLKHLAFVMLVLQNTALGIVSKYSRLVDGPKYKPGTVVFLVEAMKFLICFCVLCKLKNGDMQASVRSLRFEVFADTKGLKKMIVLAFLYAVQNMMALFAYDYVDVATYQIVYQLKIITTAMFMIVLLNRRFSFVQWCAMVTLMIGVAVCSYSRLPSAAKEEEIDHSALDSTRIIGISIVLGLAVNSGLAAAYFERVMKSHKSNTTMQTLDPLWVRNLQLSAVSIAVCTFDLLRNFGDVWTDGFFHGFHSMVWAVIFLQAVGGLTIAAVVRYSDNIVKNFGTSFSLIFSCIISNYMFDQTATFSFYMGVFLVVVSVFIYGDSRFAVKADAPSKSHAVAPSHQSHSHEIRIDTKTVESSASGSSSSTSYAAAGSGLRSHVTTRSIASFSVLSI
uniref:UDP-N-acetylglucosamine transporter n=1 Tax=Globisporangium ultimum (strain ATCC 200006 / CBS 805.95 / DAOM BR144) TaxID=431595 RepID=K3W897_GLOUD